MSEHPVDQYIRTLIETGTEVARAEIEWILNRMATAPFNSQLTRVPIHERGLRYQNRLLRAREDSFFLHLVRRVLVNGQWAQGTTPEQYLDDLRRAVRATDAKLAVYSRRGGHMAATLAPTDQAVPSARLGVRPFP